MPQQQTEANEPEQPEEMPWQNTNVYDAKVQGGSLGHLGILPGELRKIIYEYAISVEPYSDGETKSGLGLLRTSAMIFKEAIPLLYQSHLFGAEFNDKNMTLKYKYFKPGRMEPPQVVSTCISPNVLGFVQNFRIDIEDWNCASSPGTVLKALVKVCSKLQDNTQLQNLDINITFMSYFDDVNTMAYAMEPIKTLRDIRNPSIAVYGHENAKRTEPRWDLTDEYLSYLQQLLMSPHGTPCISAYEIAVFEDLFEPLESADNTIDSTELADLSTDTTLQELEYLKTMYNTEDRTALHGGMPERWKVWLELTDPDQDGDLFD